MKPDILFVLDILGIVSFTVSGVLVAIEKKMDLMGVFILGAVASMGGGVMRDILIGSTPPAIFVNPHYIGVSFITSLVVFLVFYFHMEVKSKPQLHRFLEKLFFWFDTIGLASFTANGVITGKLAGQGAFLCCFLGVITGVGGGILRDLLATRIPVIFVKHIYAAASIAGAVVITLMWNFNSLFAVTVGLILIVLIRVLARTFKWNLPKVPTDVV